MEESIKYKENPPSDLRRAAFNLRNHLHKNVGIGPEWPLELSGDDKELREYVKLFNILSEELRKTK